MGKLTLTYGELVNRLNALGEAILAAQVEKTGEAVSYTASVVPEGGAGWLITTRTDPREELLAAVGSIQRRPRGEMLGLFALRNEGDRVARMELAGYYEAVSRLIPEVKIGADGQWDDVLASPADFRRVLESEDDAAYILDMLITHVHFFHVFTAIDATGKLTAPSTASPDGQTAEPSN